jgi:hypothetical protein
MELILIRNKMARLTGHAHRKLRRALKLIEKKVKKTKA